MKKFLLLLPLAFALEPVHAQKHNSVLTAIITAQRSISTASYNVSRIDTFASGSIRNGSGECRIIIDTGNNIFGYKFRATRKEPFMQMVFDGKAAYLFNYRAGTYTAETNPNRFKGMKGSPAGQLIFNELLSLDTAGVEAISYAEDSQYLYLTLTYPDDKEEDVSDRHKLFIVEKHSHLPAALKHSMKVLGRIQSHNYFISDIEINPPGLMLPLVDEKSIGDLKQEIPKLKNEQSTLLGSSFAAFELNSFNGDIVSIGKGKVILLDFWEVWCGPCVVSLSKVQKLFDQYKYEGLSVFGIINETEQLKPSKQLVEKKGLSYPMLIGNEKIKKDFKLNAVPLYVLIDKKGLIRFIQEGYCIGPL